jgi:3-oxoacyl-[acyl-carrier-protein] synthase-3
MNLEEGFDEYRKYGNTTSATLPLVLYDFEHLFKKGDTIILGCFGGGFWGSVYLKWRTTKII